MVYQLTNERGCLHQPIPGRKKTTQTSQTTAGLIIIYPPLLRIKIPLVILFKYLAYFNSILIGISTNQSERVSSPAYTREGEDHLNFSDYSRLDNNLFPLTQNKNTVGNSNKYIAYFYSILIGISEKPIREGVFTSLYKGGRRPPKLLRLHQA